VPHKNGYHYVELLSGKEVAFEVRGNEASLSFEVPAQEVVAIAQLPILLKVNKTGNLLSVKVSNKIQKPSLLLLTTNDPDEFGKHISLQNGGAKIDLAKLELPKDWVQLKLFLGNELADEIQVAMTMTEEKQ